MKCIICHGDEINAMEVNEEFMVGNDIVYVPIKIPVCKNCGERYYDRQTMRFLEEAGKKLRRKQTALKEVGNVLVCG